MVSVGRLLQHACGNTDRCWYHIAGQSFQHAKHSIPCCQLCCNIIDAIHALRTLFKSSHLPLDGVEVGSRRLRGNGKALIEGVQHADNSF